VIEENYTAALSERLGAATRRDSGLAAFEEPGVLTLPVYEEPFVVLLPASHL